MKRLRIRRADTCRGCGTTLDVGTSAWWDGEARAVECTTCHDRDDGAGDGSSGSVAGASDLIAAETPVWRTSVGEPATLDDGERGVAGTSARAERRRRSEVRERRVRAAHPHLGGFLLALSDDPASTRVWDQGAAGEERVGSVLEAARGRGIEVLHDRRMPRSRANIDHLVVAPNGVWAVDAKRYLGGKLEQRDVGGWFTTDRRLFVGGRDRSTLLDGVIRQTEVVRAAVAEGPVPDCPVRGALCFVDIELGWFAKPFVLRDVRVTWPRQLVSHLLEPVVVDGVRQAELVAFLAARFPGM